jgi:hypothetical protein
MLAGYLGSAIGGLASQHGWRAFNPLAAMISVAGAIIVPGLNLIMLAMVVTSLVLLFKGKLRWSFALVFLGCAFVSRCMATFMYVPSRHH